MALSPRDKQHKANLIQAAQTLRAGGHTDLADSVDYVLGPSGLDFLRTLHGAIGTPREVAPNLPIKMRTSLRDAVRAGMAAGESLTPILNRGFRRFLDGEFDLRVARAPYGTGRTDPLVVLNTSPDGDLQAQVSMRCRAVTDAGRHGEVRLATVAAAVLFEYFQIGPYAPDAGTE